MVYTLVVPKVWHHTDVAAVTYAATFMTGKHSTACL